jgi:hypothetical protein
VRHPEISSALVSIGAPWILYTYRRAAPAGGFEETGDLLRQIKVGSEHFSGSALSY